MSTELSPRLESIISLVKEGAVTADIGCDHALVSVELVRRGVSRLAVLSDIRQGPLANARKNIELYCEKYGLDENKFVLLLGDGMEKAHSFSPDDIIIAGMGGEMIAKIIDESEYTRKENVRLILQPMSSVPELREYLAKTGFEIISERRACEGEKFYEMILCRYSSLPYNLTVLQRECGMREKLVDDDKDVYRKQIEDKLDRLKKIAAQKAASNVCCEQELMLIEKLSCEL